MNAHAKKAAAGMLRFFISAGLVTLLLWNVGIEDTIARLRLLEWHWALGAILLTAITGVLHAIRWRLVLAAWHYTLAPSLALREIWIGYFFNQLLPTSVGGDGVRAFRHYRAGAPLGIAFRGVLVERVFGLLACVALSVLAVPAMFWAAPDSIATLAIAIVVAGALVGSWILCKAPKWILRFLPERIRKEITLVSDGISNSVYTKGAIVISIGMQLAIATSVACLSVGLGLAVNPLLVAVLFQPVTLLTLVPVSLAGWGLREGALVATLGAVGVRGADALPMSLVFGAILLLISLPGWIALSFGKLEGHHRTSSPLGSE